MRRGRRPWPFKVAKILGGGLLCVTLLHVGVALGTHVTPPVIAPTSGEPRTAGDDPTRRDLGPSYVRRRGTITEIRLVGTPEQIGHSHVRLLYPEVVGIEQAMHQQFAQFVPLAPVRWAIVDLARWRFRGLEATMPLERRRELAAYAEGFTPDPFGVGMGTYHRFVLLNSLYDVMLAFERSPLVGCTSFVLRGAASEEGHTLVGRNFDFEGPSVLDRDKAVFLIHEAGRIPYASVSWPGFVGVSSGMNALGVGIVVHGARARTPRTSGDPVTMTVRDVLGTAHDTAEAVAMIATRQPMVPHILLVADAAGQVAIVERAPGEPAVVRRPTDDRVPLTNHFEGPWASDPANQAVLLHTSTRPRRQRLDELLKNLPAGASVERAVSLLRDKRGLGNVELPLGHRSAIDALIATHSVVMDLTARKLWVNEGPHAAGRYLAFDVGTLLEPSYRPTSPEPIETIAADEVLSSGRYQTWLDSGAPRPGAE